MKKLFLYSIVLCAVSVSQMPAFSDRNYNFSNFKYHNPDNYQYSAPEAENDREKVLFILDLSNSMNEKIGSVTKLDIAIESLKETLKMLPKNTEAGFRVYGHRTGLTPRQSCTASTLLSPIAPDNAINIYSKLGSLSAQGWTPITYSLKQAVFFDFPKGDYKKRIVLISDGGENCDESPCEYIINLMKYRDDIKIDVVALAVGDPNAVNQLRCTALVTSGKFYTANDASGLKDSLKNSLNLQKEVSGVIIKR